jgi:S-formylglutathione hydrolase
MMLSLTVDFYLLHGFGHNANGARFWLGEGYAAGCDIRLMVGESEINSDPFPAIFVCPDGATQEGGNFWEDSFTGGPIRSWFCSDVVDFVDRNYRTHACADARLVSGHSMGAQAAMAIAIERPGIFSSVYSMSGMMASCQDELLGYAKHWYDSGMPVVGQGIGPGLNETAGAYYAFINAFCGYPDRAGFDQPVIKAEHGLAICDAAAERFFSRWPLQIADAYPERLRSLRNVGFEVGIRDEYRWGIEANRIFARSLQLLEVPFVYEEYDGRHADRLSDRFVDGLLPFAKRAFRRNLPT